MDLFARVCVKVTLKKDPADTIANMTQVSDKIEMNFFPRLMWLLYWMMA